MKFIKSLFKFILGILILIVILVGVGLYFISSPKKTILILLTNRLKVTMLMLLADPMLLMKVLRPYKKQLVTQ